MARIFLLITCSSFAFLSCKTQKKSKDRVYRVVEQMPEFPGGEQALSQYIMSSVHYPDSAAYFGKEATVKVSFLIDEYGTIDSVYTKEQFGYGLNTEAERVVASMPPWKPALTNGVPVRVYFQLPIKFVLQNDSVMQAK